VVWGLAAVTVAAVGCGATAVGKAAMAERGWWEVGKVWTAVVVG
jgi:hypothetical protein